MTAAPRFYHAATTARAWYGGGPVDAARVEPALSRVLELAVAAERLGFDGTCVNAHHLGADPAVADAVVLAGQAAARTAEIRIAVLGVPLPLFHDPVQVAESLALQDVLSGGRLDVAFLNGVASRYRVSALDPTTAARRYGEALSLIVRCWTDDDFDWEGEDVHLRRVVPAVHPVQKPYPRLWLPGEGLRCLRNDEAWAQAAVLLPYGSFSATARACERHRAAGRALGHEPSAGQFVVSVPVHVAETDELAHAQARPHVEWLFQSALLAPPWYAMPPGYLPAGAFLDEPGPPAGPWPGRSAPLCYADLVGQGWAVVGSPATVAGRLAELFAMTGAGVHIGGGAAFGGMPIETVLASMTIFAEEVLPRLRRRNGAPALRGTNAS